MSEDSILRRTMTDRVTITRQVWNGARWESTVLYENLACALSRAVQSSTPKLTGNWEGVTEDDGKLTLYLPAGVRLQAGDRAEVRRLDQVICGLCSATLPYPSHGVATLYLQEVKEA
ncbi:MAG: hypothetical protein IJA56_00900 [Clostridia bacterium]|nr:hypothetical protein [Clostridia bacterium]